MGTRLSYDSDIHQNLMQTEKQLQVETVRMREKQNTTKRPSRETLQTLHVCITSNRPEISRLFLLAPPAHSGELQLFCLHENALPRGRTKVTLQVHSESLAWWVWWSSGKCKRWKAQEPTSRFCWEVGSGSCKSAAGTLWRKPTKSSDQSQQSKKCLRKETAWLKYMLVSLWVEP